MEIDELNSIVNDMAVQHAYPGFDVRALKLGLPEKAAKSPARLFRAALDQHDSLVRLAALRWFQERPGDAKKHSDALLQALHDEDEWVRVEAVRAIEQFAATATAPMVEAVAKLLADQNTEVQKAAARACGKFRCGSQAVIDLLQRAAKSNDREVRWKSQKALRKLGVYSQPG